MNATSIFIVFSLAFLALLVLPISATGEQEASQEENSDDFSYNTDPLYCPGQAVDHVASYGTDQPISYLSYVYPSMPEPMTNRTIAYQLCNLDTRPWDVIWQGPDIATGYGHPLPGGMCIAKRRSTMGSALHDTTIWIGQNLDNSKTVPTYMQCGYQEPTVNPSSYLVNRLWSVYQNDDVVRPYSLSYSVTDEKMTITWWPTDLEIVVGLDNSIEKYIDLDHARDSNSGVEIRRVEISQVFHNDTDQEKMRDLNPALPVMSDAFFFWAFRKVEDDEGAQGHSVSVPILLSISNISVERTEAPVVARIAPEGPIVLLAVFDGIRESQ